MLCLIPKYLISTGKRGEEDSVDCVSVYEDHGASQMSTGIRRVGFQSALLAQSQGR